MGTSESKAKQSGERFIEKRLREIEYIDINRLSLEELKELCHALEIEMSELDSEKASKVPGIARDRFKQHYLMIIQLYKDTVRETDSLNELIDELTKLKDLKDKRGATFEKQISTARQELEKLKSNKTRYSYYKWDLIFTIETELQGLEKEIIGQILSQLAQEIRDSIEKNTTNFKECRNIVRCYELIPELRKMKVPINKSQETTFERQISTARQELEELKSNETIDSYHKQDIVPKIQTELKRLDNEFINHLISRMPQEIRESIKEEYITNIKQCRDIVRCYEIISELTKMKTPINKSQETTFERQISTARQELKELESNKTIDSYHIWDIVPKIETELKRLDNDFIIHLISRMPQEIRESIKEEYITNIKQCRDIVRCYEIISELTKMKAPINRSQKTTFERQISAARQELEELKSSKTIGSYHKRILILKIETEFKRLDKEVTDQFLNAEVRDSIDLIEKTLAEPHLYSLPHLIMWRNTAQEKIQKIKNFPLLMPQEIVTEKIEKYESLIIQLRVEILKLRTYPIPEPWGSHCMRVELIYLMKGEFIFFVHPGIEEDMRPLKLSDRDILPGGLTRQEYDSRMNRMKREATNLKAKNERQQKWFEDSFAEIEKDVNFAFTELPLLYKDRKSLEYLVDKNQDDELLQEIYDSLLRRIRHFYNNRINIPSVAIDCYNFPMLVAPPKGERNIPIASGVDRGATDGLQLVTPASVVVYWNTVFVADKYGHSISYYRDRDLEAIGSYHHTTADTPVSITVYGNFLYACYSNELVKLSFSRGNKYIESIHFETSIQIPQICCTTKDATRYDSLFVGTLKPSLIYIDRYNLQIDQEYPLEPIRYHTNKKNRYPWLQDMKATNYSIICLFTGSPSPLQEFSYTGELLRSVLTADEIVGAYHFDLFCNPVTRKWRIYLTDFWDSAIKVFDEEGRFIETFSEEGFYLGQIIQPTGIFVEESGFITVCDMKEDNCLQRL